MSGDLAWSSEEVELEVVTTMCAHRYKDELAAVAW